jgi:co-chaperonin GroES (HSP10)
MSKLAERMKEYGIPRIPGLSIGKNVMVYRLPSEEQTVGGIIIPGTAEQVESRGVLLMAGLAARDVLRDALVEIGDIVLFGRFAGYEKGVERASGGKERKILQLKVDDLIYSEDALERLRTHKIEFDESTGEHHYEERSNQNAA